MNSTTARQTSGVIQTEGQRLDPKWSAARQQQYQALALLEEKYGGRKLRIDAAHRTSNPPHLKALQLKAYTDWLTKHFADSANSGEPASASKPTTEAATPSAMPQAAIVKPNLAAPNSSFAMASPDILATPIPATRSSSATRPQPSSRSPFSISVDKSGLSLKRMQRVDRPHAKTGKIHSRGQQSESEKKPGSDLPTTTVAWEVDDFFWPEVIGHSKLLTTGTAQIMVDAIAKSLSATEKRLAIVGSGRGKGATTISMFVAKILAAQHKKVLLVDADLAKPDLTNRLGLPVNLSWMNVINENRKCSDAIVRSLATGICVMPVSKLTARVTWPDYIFDCLSGILEEVRQYFDIVIIDVGPSSQLIRELSRPDLLVDAAILVHNARVPDKSVYQRNQNELNSFGIKKLVVAENFAAGKAA